MISAISSAFSLGDPGVIRTLDTRLRRNEDCFLLAHFTIYGVLFYFYFYIWYLDSMDFPNSINYCYFNYYLHPDNYSSLDFVNAILFILLFFRLKIIVISNPFVR